MIGGTVHRTRAYNFYVIYVRNRNNTLLVYKWQRNRQTCDERVEPQQRSFSEPSVCIHKFTHVNQATLDTTRSGCACARVFFSGLTPQPVRIFECDVPTSFLPLHKHTHAQFSPEMCAVFRSAWAPCLDERVRGGGCGVCYIFYWWILYTIHAQSTYCCEFFSTFTYFLKHTTNKHAIH